MATPSFVRFLLLVGAAAILSGCGSEKPSRREPSFAEPSITPRHDYTSTWIYAVGEVESPSEGDCKKALALVEAESDCVGAACKYGAGLAKDFEFACGKIVSRDLRAQMVELRSRLAPRAAKAPADCVQQADEWLDRGCGQDGACEDALQRWATRCSEEIRSPLTLFLLQRLVENSLREPRRVKFDVRSCVEYKAKLAAAARCDKPFDCEDAMPRIDEYLERCAEGPRKAVPIAQAAQIVRIRLGAEKAIEPIALATDSTKIAALAGTVPLADGTGMILKVCGEPVLDLTSYLDQRKRCQNGSVALLGTVAGEDGPTLALQQLWHESDAGFGFAFPKLLALGEASAREQKLIDEFSSLLGRLPQDAATDFASAFERVNAVYASFPPALRQSERLYQAIMAHDATLTTLFSLIGDQKARLATKRITDGELLGLAQRSEKLVFADISSKGAVGLGKVCELSELLLEAALPQSVAAYKQKLSKLRQLVEKRGIVAETDIATVRQTLMTYTQACSAARAEVTAANKEISRCFSSAEACSADERKTATSALEAARGHWRAARVQEILTKVAMSQRETPSAVCSSW